jgi:hypothetical protein
MKTGLLAIFWLAMTVFHPMTLQAGDFSISSPHRGDALQGIVYIQGTTAVEGFSALELTFSYSGAPGGTWFLIGEIDQPVTNGALLAWDTTRLTDGDYDLRATLRKKDGSSQVLRVNGLRVRNYTPVENLTPQAAVSPTAAAALRPVAVPTLGAFPANPAVLSGFEIRKSLVMGVGAAVGLFAVGGIYGLIRRKR